ncbi:MAG: DUF362 domain-containing protein [Terriglobia bacterium]
MTRRAAIFSILGSIAAIVVGLLLFRWRFVIRQMLSRPRGEPITPTHRADPFRQPDRARVVLTTGTNPRQLVSACLRQLGAEEKLSVAGKTILVKPNVVSGAPAPTTTNPEVVRALCEWLAERGAKTVWVGDMSAVMSRGTPASMKACGIESAARQAGAIPIYFEEHEWVTVKLPGARHLDQVPVSEYIFNADLVINLPVIKSHRWATYSVCMKNFVGATHSRYRPYMIDSEHWEEIVSELNLAYRPDLNLVDGTRVMYAGGPWRGEETEMGLVLAGGDRIACDAVAVALMKTFPTHQRIQERGVWEQTQLRHARELGLGIGGPNSLDLEFHHLQPPTPALRSRLDQMQQLLSL